VREPPGDGGGRVEAADALPESAGDLILLLVLTLAALVILRALLKRGFLRHAVSLEPTEPPLWGVREILVVFGVYIVSAVSLGVLLHPILDLRRPLGTSERAVAFLALLVLSWIPALMLILHLVRRDLGQPISALGFHPVPWRAFAACVPLYVLLLFPIALSAVVWQMLLREAGVKVEEQDLVGMFRDIARQGDIASFAVLGAGAVIVAPVCEETFFRGFVFGALRAGWGALPAAVASSALFAAVHFDAGALVPIFILGLILCGLYVRTGSLYPGVFFHAFFNGVTLTKAVHDGASAA
jgi:membrane protease YdiL (CAAX protease family)